MSLVVVTPATAEPVLLADAKMHLRVDDTAEDTLIQSFITAARQHIESICQLAIGAQTWRLSLDGFPANDGAIELPGGRVSAIGAVTYVDPLGTVQTLSTDAMRVDTDSIPARIAPAAGSLGWPNWQPVINAVTVTYDVGAPAPEPIRAAILLMVGDLFENRKQIEMDVRAGMVESPTVKRLLFPYKRIVP